MSPHVGIELQKYVLVLVIIIAVLLVMGYYIRNSLAGRIREGADVFGEGQTYLPSVEGVNNPTQATVTIKNK